MSSENDSSKNDSPMMIVQSATEVTIDELEDSYSSEEVDELKELYFQDQQAFSPISQQQQYLTAEDDTIPIEDPEPPVEEEADEPIDLDNLPATVSKLTTAFNNTIYLVGTSHFSKQSHRDVRRVIRTVQPRVVVLELCKSRLPMLMMDENSIFQEAKSLNFAKLQQYIKKNGFAQGFIYMVLLNLSAKLTKDLKLAPGGEFRNAFNEAMKIPNCSVILGDRPVEITLRRAMTTLTLWQKVKLIFNCIFSNDKFSEEELEKFKEKDILEQFIGELSKEFPGLTHVMVEERDSYLAHSLWSACRSLAPGEDVVGVVGIGHSAGIQNKWNTVQDIDIHELTLVPASKPSKVRVVLKYCLYGAVAYSVCRYILPSSVKRVAFEMSHNATRFVLRK